MNRNSTRFAAGAVGDRIHFMLFIGSTRTPPQAAPPQTQTLMVDQLTDLVELATMVAVTSSLVAI